MPPPLPRRARLALLAAALGLAASPPTFGARGGPDEEGYSWMDSDEAGGPVYEYLLAPTPIALGEEDWAEIPLPFPFPYRGAVHESVIVGSNGTLSFDGLEPDWRAVCPLTEAGGDVIAPLWSDLWPRSDSVWLGEVDGAGEGRFVVEWFRTGRYAGTGNVTFEVVLFPDGTIEFHYQDVAFGLGAPDDDDFGGAAAVGAGGPGASLQVSCGWGSLDDGYAVRISPPGACLDRDGDGFRDCDGDCDDLDPGSYPGAPERCNAMDDDCDGLPGSDEVDEDGDGHLACDSTGTSLCPARPQRVGLVQDALPFGGLDRIASLLEQWGIPWDRLGAGDLPLSDLSSYDRIVVASDQSQAVYDALGPSWPELEAWAGADRCRALVVLAGDDGGNGGISPAWPAGLTTAPGSTSTVSLDDPDAPWLSRPYDLDADRLSRATWAADFAFTPAPAALRAPLLGPDGHPLLVASLPAAGGVLATTLNAEYLDAFGFSPVLAALVLGEAPGAAGGPRDCDDGDPSVHDGAEDVCNAIDDDCDGAVDEEDDADGDRSSPCAGDCDDADPTRHPAAPEACDGVDQDCDGLIDEDFDQDGDGVLSCGGDCDDSRADVLPGAPETCDGADQDCDGEVDEGFDGDGDGTPTCSDCDDADPSRHASAAEVCDGVDQDCDGAVDEDFDADGDGATSCGGDCDDADPTVHPGADESCDFVDEDCDGAVDEGYDRDGDGYTTCAGDCSDARSGVYPGARESCNARDDDCNGVTDDAPDGDGDGVGPCAGDCDDGRADVLPGAPETCDATDNDCDGEVDEGHDADGDGFASCAGDCDDSRADVFPGAPEVCDGVDDDCDGAVDEGHDADGDGSTACGGDCDDADPARRPGAAEACGGVDEDCDGALSPAELDADGDGYSACDGDCDDARADVRPGGAEVPANGVDEDCDGADLAEGDGDGHLPAWAGGDDCLDSDPLVHPGAAEVANGVDDDCDGTVDEGTEAYDDDGDGFSERGGDCDDTDASVRPGAAEVADGRDQDCDGIADEGTPLVDDDGDGFSEGAGDCDDTDPAVAPGAPEAPDGRDQDCDGEVDEGTSASDDDGDGFSEDAGDCDDADPEVHPGAGEAANGRDDDCDGVVDEGTAASDDDGDGFSEDAGDCDDTDPFSLPGGADHCDDGVDQDCDGTPDGGCDTGVDVALSEQRLSAGSAGCAAAPGPPRGGGHAILLLAALFGLGRRAAGSAPVSRAPRPKPSTLLTLATLLGGGCAPEPAAGEPTSALVVLGHAVTFEPTRPDVPVDAVVRVRNAGSAATALRAAIEADGDGGLPSNFTLSSALPAALGPGEEAEIGVRFLPRAAGERSGTLHLTADDGAEVVTLQGAARKGGLQFAPPLVVLDAGAGGATTVTLGLRNQSIAPARVLSASLLPSGPGWRLMTDLARHTVEAGEERDVVVRYEGAAVGGPPEVVLRVVFEGEPPLDARIRADGCTTARGPVDADGDGHAACAGDCDDSDPAVHPGAPEAGDGFDRDCDGVPGGGAGDADGDGFTTDGGDCHDGEPTIHPGAVETADGRDEDCDGRMDEGTAASDDDGDGFTEEGGD
ncbi:hypothetical protein L6R50_05215, partial [Myxococcota bacterium]|nr:hypothetical protein [Myxococcota bacterium]